MFERKTKRIFIRKVNRAFAGILGLIMIISSSFGVLAATNYEVEELNNLSSVTSNESSDSYVEVSGGPTAATYQKVGVRVWQNDMYDGFKFYKIASVDWDGLKGVYKDAVWSAEVKKWISSGGGGYSKYRSYKTPAILYKASATVQTNFFNALLKNDVSNNIVNNADTSRLATEIASFSYNDGNPVKTDNVIFKEAVESVVSESNYEELRLEQVEKNTYRIKVTAITDGEGFANVSTYAVGDVVDTFNSLDDLQTAGYNSAGGKIESGATTYVVETVPGVVYRRTYTTKDAEGNTVEAHQDYEEGDVYHSTPAYFTISNLEYGIYAVVATNESGLIYNPVTVSVVPERRAPSNNYYIYKGISASIKGGDVNIEKTINNKKSDIVQIGETVDFDIITTFPQYKDRVTLSANSNSASATTGVKGYTLAFDDELSTAYTIKLDSFKLYYRQSADSDWKEFVDEDGNYNYKNITYTAITDSTYTGSAKEEITSENIGNATYDKSVEWNNEKNGYDYTKTPNSEKFLSDENGGTSYYYTTLKADAYSYVISSKSSEPDVNATVSYPNVEEPDARGGYGMSVYACGTNAHKSYFQLYLFRYQDKPSLYYWYYMRAGAYYFVCVDDIETNCRSLSLTGDSAVSRDADGNPTTEVDADGHITFEESNNYWLNTASSIFSVNTAPGAKIYSTYKTNIKRTGTSPDYTYTYKDTYAAAQGVASTFSVSDAGLVTNCEMQYKINLTDSSSYLKYVKGLYSVITGDTVNHSVKYYPDWGGNLFNVTYNYNAIRQWMEDNGVGKISQIKISYAAVVSSDCEVNSENNSNKAILTYEGNANGTTTLQKEDTVRGYTYGVNVLKLDGTDFEAGKNTYLPNAYFWLYKEVDAFVGDNWYGSMKDSPSEGLTSSTTLASYKESHPEGSGYYYLSYNASATESLDADYRIYASNETVPAGTEDQVIESDRVEVKQNGSIAEGAKVTRVFKRFTINAGMSNPDYQFLGEIKSVASSNGVTIKGLDEGNYVLTETMAPQGYTEMYEDILFSIYALDEDIANTMYAGSYAIFADDASGGSMAFDETTQTYQLSGITNANGVFSVSVLNYKGITLPSTGGMGIVIFIILGMIMMLGATVLVVIRSRKTSAFM